MPSIALSSVVSVVSGTRTTLFESDGGASCPIAGQAANASAPVVSHAQSAFAFITENSTRCLFWGDAWRHPVVHRLRLPWNFDEAVDPTFGIFASETGPAIAPLMCSTSASR